MGGLKGTIGIVFDLIENYIPCARFGGKYRVNVG